MSLGVWCSSSPCGNIVGRSREWQRIRDLPTRDALAASDIPELVYRLSYLLATPLGRRLQAEWDGKGEPPAQLRVEQAVALREAYDTGRLVGALTVGSGKTLLGLLLPQILNTDRACLIQPKQMFEAWREDLKTKYLHTWQCRPPRHMLSYQKIGHTAGVLESLDPQPDVIMCDEADWLKDSQSNVTRRLLKYLSSNKHVRLFLWSGTLWNRSLSEIWHLAHHALGEDGSPLPKDRTTFKIWDLATAQGVPDHNRWHPGALLDLVPGYTPSGDGLVEQAWDAFGKRFANTPGIVASPGGVPDIPLTITAVHPPVSRAVEECFATLREEARTPCGRDIGSALDLWRHANDLVCGFYQIWDPPAPADWVAARRVWKRYQRLVISYYGERLQLYSELDIITALSQRNVKPVLTTHDGENQIDGPRALAAWREIKDTFTPNSVPCWIDDGMLKYAAAWLTRHPRGLCWVNSIAFATKLSEIAGLPYFGALARDASGRHIYKYAGKGAAIVSSKACSTGLNLQYGYNRNLIVSTVATGKLTEQQIGRTHRRGQTQEFVTVEWVASCLEQLQGIWRAHEQALLQERTSRVPKRLVRGDFQIPSVEEMQQIEQFSKRWRK